ncbi:hypothetical protein CGCF413_v008851 [Colletotrichum fructicola]|nr:hypothetical protein CGCF413_v008851 [Colletotrichum fructicola]
MQRAAYARGTPFNVTITLLLLVPTSPWESHHAAWLPATGKNDPGTCGTGRALCSCISILRPSPPSFVAVGSQINTSASGPSHRRESS